MLLHANAASQNDRCCLTVKESRDGGLHWTILKEIYSGSAAYSDLVQVDGRTVGVFYEKDEYTKMVFARFEWESP